MTIIDTMLQSVPLPFWFLIISLVCQLYSVYKLWQFAFTEPDINVMKQFSTEDILFYVHECVINEMDDDQIAELKKLLNEL